LEQGLVPLLTDGHGLGGPHGVQDGQVVGVAQRLPPSLGRGLPGPVAAGDDLGEHAHRAGRPGIDLVDLVGVSRTIAEVVVAGNLGAGRVPGVRWASLTEVVKK